MAEMVAKAVMWYSEPQVPSKPSWIFISKVNSKQTVAPSAAANSRLARTGKTALSLSLWALR